MQTLEANSNLIRKDFSQNWCHSNMVGQGPIAGLIQIRLAHYWWHKKVHHSSSLIVFNGNAIVLYQWAMVEQEQGRKSETRQHSYTARDSVNWTYKSCFNSNNTVHSSCMLLSISVLSVGRLPRTRQQNKMASWFIICRCLSVIGICFFLTDLWQSESTACK